MARRDEERVGARDPQLLLAGQRVRGGRAGGACAVPAVAAERAALDVLRTVGEHLVDGDAQRPCRARDAAVHPHAAPRGEVDHERPERRAGSEARRQRVTLERLGVDLDHPLAGRRQEARCAVHERRPHPAVRGAARQHRERLLEQEVPRRLRDLVVDAAGDAARDARDPGALLHRTLAVVECVWHRNPPLARATWSDQRKPQLGAPDVGACACCRPSLVKISSRVPSGSSKKIPPELAPSPCGTAPS